MKAWWKIYGFAGTSLIIFTAAMILVGIRDGWI